mmetsp:Transcript_2257/g.6457  ORF Transcript_2257/g.6457 Transcript_2257/m.6457 type:complete len:120 (+) Transcript_2257:119-478(+)
MATVRPLVSVSPLSAEEIAILSNKVDALKRELAAKEERSATLDRAIAVTRRLCDVELEVQRQLSWLASEGGDDWWEDYIDTSDDDDDDDSGDTLSSEDNDDGYVSETEGTEEVEEVVLL